LPLGSSTVVPPMSTSGAMTPTEAMWNSGEEK